MPLTLVRARTAVTVFGLVLAAGAGAVAPLRADWRLFLPRPVENGATLDLFGSQETNDTRNGARRDEWRDRFWREKLTLFSNGYVYHPRFLQYRVSVGGAYKQELYEAPGFPRLGTTHGSALEYDASLRLLPEHPYNLEVYARRFESLVKEYYATVHGAVDTSQGLNLRYRRKPWFALGSYSHEATDGADFNSEVSRVSLAGQYLKRYADGGQLAWNAGLDPSRTSGSSGVRGRQLSAQLGNLWEIGRWRLSSSLSRGTVDQRGGASQRFESEQQSWSERLSARLPWHLRGDLSYRDQRYDSRFPDGGPTLRATSNRDREVGLDLVHRLFQSLDSTYSFDRAWHDYSGGESVTSNHRLIENYAKSLPRGHLLLGASVGRGETESEGRGEVADEAHDHQPVPGSFTLRQALGERASIAVFLRSPVAPFETIRLLEGVHYSLSAVGNNFEVNVLTLPPQYVVPGTYDLRVTYALAVGGFHLRSDTVGYNGSLELFDNLIGPYASYVKVTSRVLSGAFPADALDVTTLTAGLAMRRGPVRARAQYQDVDWQVDPYRAWSGELQYVGALRPNTTLSATATYLDRRFRRGPLGDASGRREVVENGSVSLQQTLFSRSLVLAVAGGYVRVDGLYRSDATSLSSSLTWAVGKLSLSAGASLSDADSSGEQILANHRAHRYYYLRIQRRLF